ncbi:protein-disulfide reductase DsbD family protein [Fundidesulfovibrio soli]|uniref:protein-disulfide reductase DsbD family protein n=1 Tax=Fundidesulfovibrio soli TaxID=2922716 RepID=UPI001FB018AF|nr:cytochrome c biogenesis protein CcdA [Fundidesulfovibrio soli]
MFKICAILLLALIPAQFSALPLRAQAPAPASVLAQPESQPSPVALSWELATVPGRGNVAVLWLTPAPGYKTYGNDPGETGLPTRVQAVATPQGVPLPVLYPPGKSARDLFEPDKTVNVYAGPTPVFILLPEPLPEGYGVDARVTLLACSDSSCWPLSLENSFSSREAPNPPRADSRPWWPLLESLVNSGGGVVQATTGEPEAAPGEAPEQWSFTPRSPHPALEVDSILKAIPLALLAGFLLNLMPCVLPVACLKLSGLLATCREGEQNCDRHAVIREHNIYFALGVVLYFTGLALILGLAGLAWGQLFQHPGLILGAAVVLFSMGLSLFGVFHLPVVDLKFASHHGRSPKAQALVTGLLATLLATPCSGPFLGGVLAWTLMQPVPVVMAVFIGIGVGMASPYLALALRPELVRFVPRPGDWMTRLEKIAGFVIMATVLYFLSILPAGLLLPALAALLATAVACHVWGAWTSLNQSALTRWSIRAVALAFAVAACVWALSPPAPKDAGWAAFSPAAFDKALGKEYLLLDFTADWCPTCKALEKTVLTPDKLASLRARYGFTAMRVDLTREDPAAMALLRALGSASIPVAALFPKGEGARSPVVLRDIFTASQLERAMGEAFGKGK